MEKKYQYWLAEVDKYGTGWMKDGPHDTEDGAQGAYYLFKRMGFAQGNQYAIAKVELLPVIEKTFSVNEDAIDSCNEMLDKYGRK